MTAENEYRLGRRAFHQNQERERCRCHRHCCSLPARRRLLHPGKPFSRALGATAGRLPLCVSLPRIAGIALAWYLLTLRRRRETAWPHPPLYISKPRIAPRSRPDTHRTRSSSAMTCMASPGSGRNATRVMQSVVLGATGSGKSTLLKNIITQDLFRVIGPAEDQHRHSHVDL